MSRIEILAGYEVDANKDGKPEIRLTPVHAPFEVPDAAADVLLMLAAGADRFDLQPGDGEVDVRVDKRWLERLKLPKIPDYGNFFIRVRRV